MCISFQPIQIFNKLNINSFCRIQDVLIKIKRVFNIIDEKCIPNNKFNIYLAQLFLYDN